MDNPSSETSQENGKTRLAKADGGRNGIARRGAAAGAAVVRTRNASVNESNPFSPVTVLHALRLKWPWILLLGTPLGALLGYLAFTSIPTPFTAYAELFCQPRRFFWDTREDGPQFDVYKQTTMRLIKDPFVLTAALRDPKVARLPYVLQSPDVLVDLSDDLRVSSPAQEFIRVEMQGKSPDELATLVNAVTDAFLSEVVAKEVEARRNRLEELRKVLDREEDKLKTQQKALRDMDKQLEVPNTTQSDSKRQAQLDAQLEIRKQLSILQPQIIELQLLLDESRQVEGESTAPEVAEITAEEMNAALGADAEYVELARQATYADRIAKEWKRRVQPTHPAIARSELAAKEAEERLSARRNELEPRIVAAIRRQHLSNLATSPKSGTQEQLDSRLKMLLALRDRYNTELENLQVAERRLAVDWVDREALAEEIESLRTTVDAYSGEVMKQQVELDNAPPPIRIHQRARVPSLPDTKKRTLMTAAGAGGGFGVVLIALLFFEIHARRLSNLATVRQHVATPVLGIVPLVPYSARRTVTRRNRLAAAYWRSVLTDAFDEIRTVLLHNPRCTGARVMLVASSSMSEGKSTCASQLALSLARAGHRVLLVDGDLRRPNLEREFGLAKQSGFCEVLAGTLSLDEAIRSTDLAELEMLPAGVLTEKVRGLLARDAHSQLIKEVSERYHFVVIDSSPVLLATDTLLLARHVDGAIVLVRKDSTQLPKLEATLHRFEMIGVPILGLLAIGLSDSSPAYGYGYGYGYHQEAYRYATAGTASESPLEAPAEAAAAS